MRDDKKIELSKLNVEDLTEILRQLELIFCNRYENYPDCCVEFFESGNSFRAHNTNWGGFIPCLEHKDLSLEQITELLGRNPVTDDNSYLFIRVPDPSEIYEENYKNCTIEIMDNLDSTYTAYCKIIDEEGYWIDSIGDNSQCYFTKEESLENAKKIIDEHETENS